MKISSIFDSLLKEVNLKTQEKQVCYPCSLCGSISWCIHCRVKEVDCRYGGCKIEVSQRKSVKLYHLLEKNTVKIYMGKVKEE